MQGIPIGGFGKRWKVRVARNLRNTWGHCDYAKREIVLCKTAQEQGVDREVLIHELLHKIMPFLSENCVDVGAVEIDDASIVSNHGLWSRFQAKGPTALF